MRLIFTMGLALCACVPIEPLELVPPDASPAECSAASECSLPAVADADCVRGRCVIVACPPGTADADGDRENGCEACDPLPGPDGCDGIDTDCDGRLDEDGDGTVDACGACDIACDGPGATHDCRDAVCVVEACNPGRYAIGGADAGCPCETEALTIDRTTLRPATMPVAPRLAFPGDGAPGAIVWTAVAEGRHRLMRSGLTPAGDPVGEPAEVAVLDGPRDVRDAWFDADGDLVALLAAPDGDRARFIAWRAGAPRDLGGGCTAERCRVVRLPDGRAGLIRLETRDGGFRVLDPDGGVLANLPADPERPDPELLDAACLSSDGCLVSLRRGALAFVGLADADADGLDEAELATIDDRIWLVARVGDQLITASADGTDEEYDVVELPVTGWRSPRLLRASGGGAWLVAMEDGDPVALRLDSLHQPMGEPRRLTAGFIPDGLAAPDIFFDHSLRAATVERLLWVGAPDTTPVPDLAPGAVGGLWVYRAASGIASVPTGGPDPVSPRLVLRQPSAPDSPPAVAMVDGRPLLLGAVPTGLARVDLASGERQLVPLEIDGEPAVLRPSPEAALSRDGSLAVVAEAADGRALIGWGAMDGDAVGLMPSPLGHERAPRLAGGGGAPLWLVTRLDPGVGHQTIVRRLDDDQPPRLLGRRAVPESAVAAHGARLVIVWLDRLSDRCGDGPDRIRSTSLAADGTDPAPAVELSASGEPICPRDVALTSDTHGVYALVSTAAEMHMVALDPFARPAAPPVAVPVDDPGPLGVDRAQPTAVWLDADGIESLPFDCRADRP